MLNMARIGKNKTLSNDMKTELKAKIERYVSNVLVDMESEIQMTQMTVMKMT